VATKDMGRKVGSCCAPFFGGGAGSPSNTMCPGPRPTSVPSGILNYPAVWPQQTCAEKWWAVPLFRGSWVPIYQNVTWAEANLRTRWHLDPSSHLATIDVGHKVGEAVVLLFWGVAGSPSNAIRPEPRPTSMPSVILIHPTIWPQYTNVTDRTTQTRQDRQTMVR